MDGHYSKSAALEGQEPSTFLRSWRLGHAPFCPHKGSFWPFVTNKPILYMIFSVVMMSVLPDPSKLRPSLWEGQEKEGGEEGQDWWKAWRGCRIPIFTRARCEVGRAPPTMRANVWAGEPALPSTLHSSIAVGYRLQLSCRGVGYQRGEMSCSRFVALT